MSTKPGEVRINITGNADRLKKATTEATSTVGKMGTDISKQMKKINGSIGAMGKNLTRNVTLPILGALALATKAAVDEEAEIAALHQTLKNAAVPQEVIDSTDQWVTSFQNLSGFIDGDVRSALGEFIRQGESVTKAQTDVALAADIARAKNIDLAAATSLVIKANQGSSRSLKLLGISAKTSGGDLKTAAQISEELTAKYSGNIAAFAGTTAGKMAIAKAQFQDLTEEIGNQLLPYLTRLMDWVSKNLPTWITKMEELKAKHGPLIEKVVVLVAVLGPLLTVVSKVGGATGKMVGFFVDIIKGTAKMLTAIYLRVTATEALAVANGEAAVAAGTLAAAETAALSPFLAVAGAIALVIAIVALLVGGIILIVKHNKTAKKVFTEVWNKIKEVVGKVAVWFQETWDKTLKAVSKWWKKNGKAVEEAAGHIVAVIAPVIQYILDSFQSIWPVIKAVWDIVYSVIKFAIQLIIDIFKTIVDVINGDFGKAWNDIKDLIYNIWNGIVDIVKGAVNLVLVAMGAMVNGAIDALNFLIGMANNIPGVHIDVIGKVKWKLPSDTPAPSHGSGGHRHSGGVVPGVKGRDTLMTLQAGEVVLTSAQAARMKNGGGHTFNITVSGSNATAGDIAKEIAWQMKTSGR